jgi:long-chain acyl-CoA synthetase
MTSDVQSAIERAIATGTINSLWAQIQPDVAAVKSAHGDRSYAELNAHANQIARMLRAEGVEPGDSVALLCANRPEFVEVLQAANRSGLRLTPINWHVTAEEAAYVIADCNARALFADTRFAAVATAAVTACRPPLLVAIGGEIEGFTAYDDALHPHSTEDLPDPRLGTTMLYTSGTTGRPKGVHRDITGTMSATAQAQLQRRRDAAQLQAGIDVTLVTGPLYHAAPLAFALGLPLACGTTVVLMDGWDAAGTLRLVEEHGVTNTHMVPTMFHRLLSLPDDVRSRRDLSSLRLIWHGAAPCPVPVKQAMMNWLGPIVWEYYGATEGLTTVVSPQEWLARPGTVGLPESGQIEIRHDDGQPSPAGEPGTIFIKAPDDGRFRYHGDDGKTAKAYRGDYYTLGDIGYVDTDGWLFLTDRSADLIISGGANIYPAEVEGALLQHPAVGDAAVIGLPNEEWGEEVKAVIELREGHAPSPELAAELVAFTRQHIATYKCPRSVDFVEQLPRADTGKLYKRQLRDRYRAAVSTAPG